MDDEALIFIEISKMARVTRLELATSGVTGRRSNQTELHPHRDQRCRPEAGGVCQVLSTVKINLPVEKMNLVPGSDGRAAYA